MSARPESRNAGPPAPHRVDMTPPRPLFKIKNPFERTLVETLGSHTCSPGMFKIRESSGGSFKWDIEQVSILRPADIVACNSQFHQSPDPALEKKATEAIEKFFSQDVIVPSPFDDSSKKVGIFPKEIKETVVASDTNKCSAWTQTSLTFPSVLTPEMETMLEQFRTYKGDQNDADTSANLSLKRKLLFEKDLSDGEENNFIVHSSAFLEPSRGIKRISNSSESYTSCNVEMNTETSYRLAAQKSISPILEMGKYGRCISEDISQQLKSPSLSPIALIGFDKEHRRRMSSCKADLNYSFDASICSQSTPEKSLSSTNSNIDSSPDNFDSSETKLIKDRFKSGIGEFKKRHPSRSVIPSKGGSRFRMINGMDISSDISMNFNEDKGFQETSGDSLSLEANNLEMEFVETDLNIGALKKFELYDGKQTIKYEVFEDKNSIDSDIQDKFSDLYQFVTPTKSLRRNLADITNNSERNWGNSPMQMSFENSYNFDANKPSDENESNSTNIFQGVCRNFRGFNDGTTNSKSAKKMDSGFLENANGTLNRKMFNNTAKCNSTVDVTKSFQSTAGDSSGVGWKRFDSGFHDETSSDFISQISQCGETTAKNNKKYTTVFEYMNENNNDLNDYRQNSMCTSENFTEDMVSLMKYNLSSTPSKSQSVYQNALL